MLKLNQELGVVFDLVEIVFLAAGVLFAAEGRRVLQKDAAVFTVEIWHFNSIIIYFIIISKIYKELNEALTTSARVLT